MQSKLKFVGLVVIVLFLFKTAGARQKAIDTFIKGSFSIPLTKSP